MRMNVKARAVVQKMLCVSTLLAPIIVHARKVLMEMAQSAKVRGRLSDHKMKPGA